jgi:DNA-binding response OmpR family regulator
MVPNQEVAVDSLWLTMAQMAKAATISQIVIICPQCLVIYQSCPSQFQLGLNLAQRFGVLQMAQLLVLTASAESEVLPALSLLSHRVRYIAAEPASLVNAPGHDLVFLDARKDLASSKAMAKILVATGLSAPLIVIISEGGLAAMNSEWGASDIILDTAGPAEIETRVKLAISRAKSVGQNDTINASGVVIDEASYSAKIHGRPLDLTFKEFELLKFLAQHPGRVFSRDQLLSEVWGYDYFGGTRTVDVHIRRLRAKLGDLEALIGTVRNVGYRFNPSDSELASL